MRFQRRLRVLYLAFCVGLGIVWLRAGQLQIVDGAHWQEVARTMRQHRAQLEPRRGSILSADGAVLAEDRHGFQLALIPWEWQRRGRARCGDCGAMYYERGPNLKTKYIPASCACARYARRGGSGHQRSDPYPRTDIPVDAKGSLQRIPDGDVSDLERALDLEPGTIARRAKERIEEIHGIIERVETAERAKGDTSVFLETLLKQRREDLLKRRFLLVGDVPPDVARLVLTDEDGRYRGLRIASALRRYYPQGDFAPWLLGWTSKMRDAAEVKRLRGMLTKERITLETRWGRRGLERAYNHHLHGFPGEQVRQLDPQGRFTRVLRDVPPRPGKTLHSSVHLGASREAEVILDDVAKEHPGGRYYPGGRPSGAFLMIDAHTGEILIWSEIPRFDLNEDLGDLYDPDRVEPIKNPDGLRIWEPKTPLEAALDLETWRSSLVLPVPLTLSRVGQIAVEPGSTLKPLIGLAMLSTGLALPMEGYVCDGGSNPGCHHCGEVRLERAICRSCNRYFALSLRDSRHWPVYRTAVGAFIDSLGLGHRPTSECSDWVDGRWLWDWYDFPFADATAAAQRILDERYAPAEAAEGTRAADGPQRRAPRIELTQSARTPETVAGDMPRLAAKLADLADWVAERAGTDRVQVGVSQEARVGANVTLRFTVRAAGPAGWFALPAAPIAPQLPRTIARMKPATRGLEGDVARGGYAWFQIEFPRRIGRTDPSTPPVIRPEDGRNAAIGQGPVLATPLQMARAVAVVANGGYLVEPHAVRSIGIQRVPVVRRNLHLDPAHLTRIRTGMWEVCNDPEGTAYQHAPWSRVQAEVYGKTGTAQVGKTWAPWRIDENEEKGPWHHWFVGFAEAPGQRTVAFACVLHSRTEGGAGSTAAPATARILAHWFGHQLGRQRAAGK